MRLVEFSLEWYEAKFKALEFSASRLLSIKTQSKKIFANKDRYQKISESVTAPWYMIGAIHCLESSMDFRAVLHNGERIVGTSQKTTLVPRGRGPFRSFEESAIDALRMKKYDEIADWPIGVVLKRCEAYNGLGYQKHHPEQPTPYLWASSDQCKIRGKYTHDGVYSKSARTDGQIGVATTIKMMIQLGLITEDEYAYYTRSHS